MKVVQQGLNIHADCVGGGESGKRDGTAKTMLNALESFVGLAYCFCT